MVVSKHYYTCPVCGFDHIEEEPWLNNSPSYYICPSCGTEYGYDDYSINEKDRLAKHKELLSNWIKGGMEFWSQDDRKPTNWNPIQQLRNIGIKLNETDKKSI